MTLGLGLYMQDAIVVLSQTSLVLLVHPKHGPLAIVNSVVPLKSKLQIFYINWIIIPILYLVSFVVTIMSLFLALEISSSKF